MIRRTLVAVFGLVAPSRRPPAAQAVPGEGRNAQELQFSILLAENHIDAPAVAARFDDNEQVASGAAVFATNYTPVSHALGQVQWAGSQPFPSGGGARARPVSVGDRFRGATATNCC